MQAIVRSGTALAFLAVSLFASQVRAQGGPQPIVACTAGGIGQAVLVSDLPTLATTNPPNDTSVTITEVSPGTTAGVPYCLVKLRVQPAINIWVGLPTEGRWNGRLQSEGGGGYAGAVAVATGSIAGGYIGVQTDTGHVGGSGTFGMLTPVPNGAPDVQLQTDFAYRSEHLMAVLGKQLAQAFYGQQPVKAFWNGCSTGGRQGMRMAQQFPADYDGILAGAPAFHWDRFQAEQIWPQVAMPIDGVVDGLLTDPRKCTYNPVDDATLTTSTCTATDPTCLTRGEATAIQKIWAGPTNAKGKQLWYGQERGTALNGLGGATPFPIAVAQPRYWVYFDPAWDWTTLTYANYEAFFKTTMMRVNPLMSTENPDLSAFRDRGGKLLTWHGFADQLIMPQGTNLYYDSVANTLGGYDAIKPWYRHFLAPGVGHCGGGSGHQPQDLFQRVVDWVENGTAPDRILATRTVTGVTQSRPLCPYPNFARYAGAGDPNDAASYVCAP